jgi:serine/threonine protein kinase
LQNCLHQNCVVRWDLKSMNILVKCDEHERQVYSKVADFGLSKRKESSCMYTKLMMDWGTTWWMTPELFGDSEDHVGPSGQVSWVYHWSIPSELTSTAWEWHVMRFWQEVSLSTIPNWRNFKREWRMVWGQIYLNNVLNNCPPWFEPVIIPTLHGFCFLTFMALWHIFAFHVYHTWWECSLISDLDGRQKSIRAWNGVEGSSQPAWDCHLGLLR